jgi:hypothetical protein
MSSSVIAFGVERVKDRGPVSVTVDGRNFEGDLSVGDTFTRLYNLTPAPGADRYGGPEVRVNDRGVALRVEAIRAYGRNWTVLDHGLTAELELAGVGADLVEPRDVLGVALSGPNVQGP